MGEERRVDAFFHRYRIMQSCVCTCYLFISHYHNERPPSAAVTGGYACEYIHSFGGQQSASCDPFLVLIIAVVVFALFVLFVLFVVVAVAVVEIVRPPYSFFHHTCTISIGLSLVSVLHSLTCATQITRYQAPYVHEAVDITSPPSIPLPYILLFSLATLNLTLRPYPAGSLQDRRHRTATLRLKVSLIIPPNPYPRGAGLNTRHGQRSVALHIDLSSTRVPRRPWFPAMDYINISPPAINGYTRIIFYYMSA